MFCVGVLCVKVLVAVCAGLNLRGYSAKVGECAGFGRETGFSPETTHTLDPGQALRGGR